MGMKGNGEEIVQVQGGHIVRPTGRKDRHSKVYTAKGPRDRRVRLSAYTAIQFYDVQDRLGYDRPSKAVDWLIKKAKTAIDKLAELPPWQPTANDSNANLETDEVHGSNEMAVPGQLETPGYGFQLQRQFIENPSNNSLFTAAHMDPEVVPDPDTMKSFFPTSSTASSLNFQSYSADLISRTANHTEDLGLSLHSFQDQTLVHGHSQENASHTPSNHYSELFTGSGPVGIETNFHRNVAWGKDSTTFPQQHQPTTFVGQGLDFSQRGLQSSFAQYVRMTQELHHSISGSGFNIPAGIHGEEEHSVVSDRPSTSSPNSQQ